MSVKTGAGLVGPPCGFLKSMGDKMKKNVVLIGMPGCGKSTTGVVLAKALGFDFVDSDLVIQKKYGKKLEEIIDKVGPDEFNRIEEQVNAELEIDRTILATGGSVVYGPKAMENFHKQGIIVYIKLSYEEIEKRLGSLKERGVSIKDGQTLRDLYDERIPLYEKYADITADTSNMDVRESVLFIMEKVKEKLDVL